VNAVAWSPDGQKIASTSDDKLVLICDRTGNTLLTYRGHHDHVSAVAWSPNGQYIASGSADKTVQLWDATSGKLVFTYNGHKDAVNAVAWSADNRLVASGSDDKTVQAWFAIPGKLTIGELFLTYGPPIGHTAGVTSVAWSADSSKIASGSWDNTLQVCSAFQNDAFAVGDRIFSAKIHGSNTIVLDPQMQNDIRTRPSDTFLIDQALHNATLAQTFNDTNHDTSSVVQIYQIEHSTT
jgi:WD40 repeat protein